MAGTKQQSGWSHHPLGKSVMNAACCGPSTRTMEFNDQQSLNHSKRECKYHVVFIPKCRRKTLYAQLRRRQGEVFRRLAEQKESKIDEGHLMPDHVHMMISIQPKYAVPPLIGFIKGKRAIHL